MHLLLTAFVAVVLAGVVAAPASAVAPAVDFSITPAVARAGAAVDFTAAVTPDAGATVVTYVWDFGDTALAAGAQVSHPYGAPGSYPVTLTVVDSNGETASAVRNAVVAGDPTATFSVSPSAPDTGQTVTFDASGSGDPGGPANYSWNFGDGGTSNQANPTHTYTSGGDKTATLTVTATLDGRTATANRTVSVHANAAPAASFSFAPAKPRAGDTVTFTSTSSDPDGAGDIASFSWDLDGDGAFDDGTGATVSRVYPAGPHTVKLRVTDSRGVQDTATRTVTAFGPPSASFSFSPANPGVNTAVSFDGSASGDPAGSLSYSWDFGGEGTGTGAKPNHTFTSRGDKLVTLTVTSTVDGRTATASKTVRVNAGPSAGFTVSPAPTVGESVTFTSTASDPDGAGDIASVAWDLDNDGGFDDATGPTAVRTFTVGPHTVKQRVTDAAGATADATKTFSVNGKPLADFTYAPAAPRAGVLVTFTSTSTDPNGSSDLNTFSWDLDADGVFDDGNGTKATGTFAAGSHTVTLRVTDQAGLEDKKSIVVDVFGASGPAFSFSPSTANIGQPVAFVGIAPPNPRGAVSYAWDFGDTSSATGASPSHSYTAGGDKTVTLTTTEAGDGRKTSVSRTVHVNGPPVAAFTISATPAVGVPVVFTSTATDPDGSADLRDISWDLDGNGTFGDQTGSSVQVIFQTAGTHAVGMQVTDRSGGFATSQRTFVVLAAPPAPPATTPGTTAPVQAPVVAPGATKPVVVPGPTKVVLKVPAGVRVQVTGSVRARITRITRITVLAPSGAAVVASCKGRGCPKRSVRAKATSSGRLRLRALERTLRAGAQITITVAKKGFMTKRVVLTARPGRPPGRKEACLVPGLKPGTTKSGPCVAA